MVGHVFDRGRDGHDNNTSSRGVISSKLVSNELPVSFASNVPVVLDSGASKAITGTRSDFVGDLRPPSSSRLEGVDNSPLIEGEGEVQWCLRCKDDNGKIVSVLLTIPAFFVPASKFRLLSPQVLSDGLNADVIKSPKKPFILRWRDPSGIALSVEAPVAKESNVPLLYVTIPTPSNNRFIDVFDFTAPKAAAFVTDESNKNLSRNQKLLLRLHYRLGHISLATVQWLARSGIFGQAAKDIGSCVHPKCHACETMKAKRRATKATTTTATPRSKGALIKNDLRPGQRLSVDFFKSPVSGRGRTSIRGSLSTEKDLVGGMIMVDHASNKVFVEFQHSFTATAAIDSKRKIEKDASSQGVLFESFLADNDRAFNSVQFQRALEKDWQTMRFSGAHAHHQNGKAERAIGTVMSLAGTMMMHAWTRWPEEKDDSLWPLAVRHAVHIWNNIPNTKSGLSPEDVFSGSLVPLERLSRLHVWGCPAYVLEPTIANGNKVPKWNPRSRRGIYVGDDPSFASTVGLILNKTTRSITPQFHVVYDDWFSTCYTDGVEPPPEWGLLFEHSCENYLDTVDDIDSNDGLHLLPELNSEWMSEEQRRTRLDSASPIRNRNPNSTDLPPVMTTEPSPSPSSAPSQSHTDIDVGDDDPADANEAAVRDLATAFEREKEATSSVPPSFLSDSPPNPPPALPVPPDPDPDDGRTQEIPTPQEQTDKAVHFPSNPVKEAGADPIPPKPILKPEDPTKRTKRLQEQQQRVKRELRQLSQEATLTRRLRSGRPINIDNENPTTMRSRRMIKPKKIFDPSGLTAAETLTVELSEHLGSFTTNPVAFANQFHTTSFVTETMTGPVALIGKKTNDPDLPTVTDALTGPDKDKFVAAMQKEVSELERKGAWEVVERSSVPEGANVIPGTWVMRRKRLPNGEIKSHKARFCVRGDKQRKGIDYDETYSPVVQWPTIRLLLTLSVMHGLETRQVDYTNAFVQANLKKGEQIFVEIPQYFKSVDGFANPVLSLKKALYGSASSPLRFFEHCRDGFLKRGFTQSKYDPCLFLKDGLVALVYVDDCLFFGRNGQALDDLVTDLQKDYDLKCEGTVGAFLGIDIQHLPDGRLELKQTGLIDKVLDETNMQDSHAQPTPATATPLGPDIDGDPPDEKWRYATVVGMLMYLAGNSRPDIAFAVHQCARFTHAPRKSHEQAVKRICRYLRGTRDRGLIFSPSDGNALQLDCYVDADFAGLWGTEDDQSPMSVKSRTGYVLLLNDCPILWVSKLQTEIALSTMEAEYIALSQSMRDILPMRGTLNDVGRCFGLVTNKKPITKSTVFEDNNGARTLATVPRLTPRSKHIGVKYHFFRQHVTNKTIDVVRVDSKEQKADIFTKGLTADLFEHVREILMGW